MSPAPATPLRDRHRLLLDLRRQRRRRHRDRASRWPRRGHARPRLQRRAPRGRLDRRAGRTVVFHPVEAPAYPQLKHSPYTLALTSKIVEVARRERLDVVHAHYALPHAVSADLARQILAAADGEPRAPRIVTTLHGTDITLVGSDPSFLPLTRFSIAASDAVTAPSALARARRRAQTLGVPDAIAIDVIPNFVDTDRFTPAPRRAATRRATRR